jgi:hypothetical protein
MRTWGGIRPWLLLALLVLMGAVATLVLLWPRTPEPEAPAAPERRLEAPWLVPVRLYFGAPAWGRLQDEIQWIPAPTSPEERIRALVAALQRGSRRGGRSFIPREASLAGVYLDGRGGVYLDFTAALRTLMDPDPVREWMAVRSLVATVLQNVPGIDRVWIMVEGDVAAPLVREVPLDRPYGWEDVAP